MPTRRIADAVDLEEALCAPRFLLFKHSKACGVSTSALRELEAFLAVHPQVPSGWLEVRRQRSLSDAVAARTGIRHESPQALWIVDGAVVWHASHFDITRESLARATGA